ncbi:helix-turn-helix domain-containing protein [Shimia sp.]|uniref:IclR family transcriptional regulator n=1 Tax=Shimia sp. TaxID=1954381 RepID=UPI0032979301
MSKKPEKLQKYSAPALEKGLDILEFLSLSDFKPTLSEIASGIDRSKSEIFRMMIVLEERGYIQRFDGDTYTMTDRLSVLGAQRSFNSRLSELAQPQLKQLSDETGYSNHLSVLDENQMLVIANMDASKSYGLSLQIGFRTDLSGSGTAACLLAGRRDTNSAIATMSKADRDQIMQLSKDCLKDGYVLSPNPELHSVLELSAPVTVGNDQISVAAVTLAILDTKALQNAVPDIASHLKSAVAALGRKIDIAMPSLAYRIAHN